MSASNETAFAAAMVRALRRRAAALSEEAKTGEAIVEKPGHAPVVIRSPEAAHARRVAEDWATIAAELEGEAQ